MALPPPHLSDPALLFGFLGHSTTPLPLAAAFIALAIGLRVLRARGRGGRRGPWGGGPTGGTRNDQPVHWDIRKTPEPKAAPDTSSEEQNPPSDL